MTVSVERISEFPMDNELDVVWKLLGLSRLLILSPLKVEIAIVENGLRKTTQKLLFTLLRINNFVIYHQFNIIYYNVDSFKRKITIVDDLIAINKITQFPLRSSSDQ